MNIKIQREKKNIKRRIDKAIYVNNFYINISHFDSLNFKFFVRSK